MYQNTTCDQTGATIADPYSCDHYFECNESGGQRVWVHQDCAPGTHWDRERNICNWPEEANCWEIPLP
ncbi:hypothetical protein GO755_34590 [Spirosoma sp. HMF4905]|uniref:Chitin-binding type-2 domain-containing protein n=1 Tax=Spirosoma arboris TaxID=2682092 RepID=A0A7K1SN24_9BACT|nr:hypothetical protein [Spirosoma arboris]